ncbi:MAG: hypothetical protein AB7V46_08385 [Thermomicrobiales bacterium]|jgi:hypothetical protein
MAPGFFLLLSMAVAGVFGLGWWAPALGGIALHLTVAHKYWPLLGLAREAGKECTAAAVWAISVVQALLAASGAYAMGVAFAWLGMELNRF